MSRAHAYDFVAIRAHISFVSPPFLRVCRRTCTADGRDSADGYVDVAGSDFSLNEIFLCPHPAKGIKLLLIIPCNRAAAVFTPPSPPACPRSWPELSKHTPRLHDAHTPAPRAEPHQTSDRQRGTSGRVDWKQAHCAALTYTPTFFRREPECAFGWSSGFVQFPRCALPVLPRARRGGTATEASTHPAFLFPSYPFHTDTHSRLLQRFLTSLYPRTHPNRIGCIHRSSTPSPPARSESTHHHVILNETHLHIHTLNPRRLPVLLCFSSALSNRTEL